MPPPPGRQRHGAWRFEGLKAATRRVFGAGWQRCRVHWMRNALAYVPKTQQSMVAAALRQAFLQPDRPQASAMLRHLADQFRQKWPKLAAFIDDSETEVLSYLDFPEPHRSKLHSTDEIDKHFSARLPAGFGIGGALGRAMQPFLSVEGTVAKRAARMRLCQRRQPPKAVAAGQRLQSRILAATIARGARGAALFKGKVAGSRTACSGRNLVRVVSSVCTGDRVAKSKAGG